MRKILLATALVSLASTSLWATDDLSIPEASSSSSSSSSASSAAAVQPVINNGLDLFVYTSKVSDKEKLRQQQTYPNCAVDEYYSVAHDTKLDILEYLSTTSLENMSKVSKGWRALVLGHASSFSQVSFIEGKTDPKLVALNKRAIALHKGTNVAPAAPVAGPAHPTELFDPMMGLRHLPNDGQIYATEATLEYRDLVDDLMTRARLGNMEAAVLVLQLTRSVTDTWRLNMPLLRFIRDKTKPKTADEIRDFNYNLATCALVDQIQRRASGGKIYNAYDHAVPPASFDTTSLDRDTYLKFIQMLKTVDDVYFGNVSRLLHFSGIIAAGKYKLTDAIERKTMGPAMIETITKVRSRERKIEDLKVAYEVNQFIRKNYGIPFLPSLAQMAMGFGMSSDWPTYLEIENPRFGIEILIKHHLDSVPN